MTYDDTPLRVPSGGSKWVIIAPYVMEAAHMQQVHLGWIPDGRCL